MAQLKKGDRAPDSGLQDQKAVPKAAAYFGDAIKGMSIEDARKILSRGDTATTSNPDSSALWSFF